jgi:phage terminase large subunit GpA-like protein
VSERPIRRFVHGVPRLEWVHDRTVRNEALDARVYASAALHGLRAHGFRLDDAAAKVAETPLRSAVVSPPPRPQAVIRSSWMSR